MRKRALLVAIGVPLTILVIGGFPRGGDAQVFYGCYHRHGDGEVRIVSSPNQCKKHETPITWNAVGPIGPAGPA
jgi:hypothetical protein